MKPNRMTLSENLDDSFKFTMKLLDDVGNLIILFILSIIPIVDLIILGYSVLILRDEDALISLLE
jgi:hypothetical protein